MKYIGLKDPYRSREHEYLVAYRQVCSRCPSKGYDWCVKAIIAKHETTIASTNRNSEGPQSVAGNAQPKNSSGFSPCISLSASRIFVFALESAYARQIPASLSNAFSR